MSGCGLTRSNLYCVYTVVKHVAVAYILFVVASQTSASIVKNSTEDHCRACLAHSIENPSIEYEFGRCAQVLGNAAFKNSPNLLMFPELIVLGVGTLSVSVTLCLLYCLMHIIHTRQKQSEDSAAPALRPDYLVLLTLGLTALQLMTADAVWFVRLQKGCFVSGYRMGMLTVLEVACMAYGVVWIVLVGLSSCQVKGKIWLARVTVFAFLVLQLGSFAVALSAAIHWGNLLHLCFVVGCMLNCVEVSILFGADVLAMLLHQEGASMLKGEESRRLLDDSPSPASSRPPQAADSYNFWHDPSSEEEPIAASSKPANSHGSDGEDSFFA